MRLGPLLFLAALPAAFAYAAPTVVSLEPIGGPGGSPYLSRCNEGEACLLLVAAQSATPDVGSPALRAELLAMQREDQALRTATPVDVEAVIASDASHTARMRQVLAEHGWPTPAQVGTDGAAAAWLLVQHADAAPDFQMEALALMEPLLASGQVKRESYAYLWDRTHQPQRFGTQGSCVGKGIWKPDTIESPDLVESRRKEMEMEPLVEYVAMASRLLCGRR